MDVSHGLPSPSSTELSQEQHERIQRSRAEALARRAAARERQRRTSDCRPQGNSLLGWVTVAKPEPAAKRHCTDPPLRAALDDVLVVASRNWDEAQGGRATKERLSISEAKSEDEELIVLGSRQLNDPCSSRGTTLERQLSQYKHSNSVAHHQDALTKAKAKEKVPSPEQMAVLQALCERKSVFVTGSAGTGKSFLLEFAVRQLRVMHGSSTVHVTASTGLAACALGGSTLHAFAGIGLGESKAEVLLAKVMSKRELRMRWQEARALIIDEISMVDAPLIDKLDFIARGARHDNRPFGGIQLLVTGDFFQLPPVSKGREKQFAFQAQCWDGCFDLQVQLTTVFRQSQGEFVRILNELRRGRLTQEASRLLTQRMNAPLSHAQEDGIIATKLYPYRVDVAGENSARLRELRSNEYVYVSMDETDSEYAERQLENTRAERRLCLRVGAQVMLLKNLDTSKRLVNGSRGVVVRFMQVADPQAFEHRVYSSSVGACGVWPVVKFASEESDRLLGPDTWSVEKNGVVVAKRVQIPLALAWALSVHKCQGMTLDCVETDLSRAFDYGMVYVALSRVRSLEGLHLKGFDPSKIMVHPKVVEFYDNLQRGSEIPDS